jgi:cytochrome P450
MSFALLEGAAILATLLPAVRLTAVEGDPKPKLRITLRPGAGLPMRLTPRRSGPHPAG